MKTDIYTKSVLTIIAVCLILLVVKDSRLITPASASAGTGNMNYGLVPLNEDGTISVRLDDHNVLDVNIADISTTDELDINIDKIGGGYVSSGGPLNVKISN